MGKKIFPRLAIGWMILVLTACAGQPEPTPTIRPIHPPTATLSPLPTETPRPTPPSPPTLTPTPERLTGPFDLLLSLKPEIFSSNRDQSVEIRLDYEREITTIIAGNGLTYLSWEGANFLTARENQQLLGADHDNSAWLFIDNDGSTISRVDYEGNSSSPTAGWMPIENPASLVGNGVVTGPDGNVWLATQKDVRRYDGERWTIWGRAALGIPEPESEDFLSPMRLFVFHGPDQLWLASCDIGGPGPTGSGGARWWDGNRWQGVDSPADSGCITSVCRDGQGVYWLGVDHELWRYNPADGNWQAHPFLPPPEPYYRSYAEAVVISPQGIPWVSFNLCGGASCYDYLLAYYQNGEWIPVGEVSFAPHKLLFAPDGDLWLLKPDGVYQIVDGDPFPVSELFPLAGVIDQRGRLLFVAVTQDKQYGLYVEVPQ